MRKTEAYDLNLIDSDDTFSPEPINENTQKLEDALAAAEDRLTKRLKTLESHKLVTGTYTGTYNTSNGAPPDQTIELGFTPAAVIVRVATFNSPTAAMVLPGSPMTPNSSTILQIVPGGFTASTEFNKTGNRYNYLAIL